MNHVFSFCKLCEMYHVDWDKSDNLNKEYETHLTPIQKLEAQSFDWYRVPVNGLKRTLMMCYSPSAAVKLKEQMKAFYDEEKQLFDV